MTRTPSNALGSSAGTGGMPASEIVDRWIGDVRAALWRTDATRCVLAVVLWGVGVWLTWLVVDHWVADTGVPGRLFFWILGIAGTAFWLYRRGFPLWSQQIDPAYAAAAIERDHPQLRQALTSYITLRREGDAKGIRASVIRGLAVRSATVLQKVDALPSEVTGLLRFWLLALAAVLAVLVYWAASPKSSWQSTQRLLLPWSDIQRPTRVRIGQVFPADETVMVGRPVAIRVDLSGLRDDDTVVCHIHQGDSRQSLPMRLSEEPAESGSQRFETVVVLPPGRSQHADYRIDAGDASTRAYRLTPRDVPVVSLESIELTPPEYTGIESWRQSSGPIRAVDGTKVRIRVRGNRPLRKAVVQTNPASVGDRVVATGRSFAMKPAGSAEDDGTWETEFVLRRSDTDTNPTSYRVRIWDQDDQANPDPIVYPIECVADLKPDVTIVVPTQSPKEIPLDAQQVIEVHASDPDFGLNQVRLLIDVNGRPIPPRMLWQAPPTSDLMHPSMSGKTGNQIAEFAVRADRMRLNAGDVVRIRAIATDNRYSVTDDQIRPNENVTDPVELRWVEPEPRSDNTPAGDDGMSRPEPSSDQSSSAQSDASSGGDESSDETDGDGDSDGANEGGDGQGAGDQEGQGSTGANGGGDSDAGEDAPSDPNGNGEPQDDSGDGGEDSSAQDSGEGDSGDARSGGDSSGGNQSDNAGDDSDGTSESDPGESTAGKGGGAADPESGQAGAEQGGSGGDQNADQNPQAGTGQGTDRDEAPGDSSSVDGAATSGSDGDTGEPLNAPEDSGGGGRSANSEGQRSGGQPDPDATPDTPPSHDGDAFERIQEFLKQNQDSGGSGNQSQSDQNDPSSPNQGAGGSNQQNEESTTTRDATEESSGASPSNEPGDESIAESSSDQESPQTGTADSGQPPNDPPSGSQGPATGDESAGGAASETSGDETGDAPDAGTNDASTTPDAGTAESTSPENHPTDSNPAGQDDAGEPSMPGDPGSPTDAAGSPSPGGASESSAANEEAGTQGTASSSSGRDSATSATSDTASPPAAPPDPVDLDYAKQATDLVLDYLERTKDQPDKELLQQLNWTADDLERFRQRWSQMRDMADQAGQPGQLDEFEDSLRSLGLRQSDTVRSGGRQDGVIDRGLRDSGERSRPPAAFREAFEAFRRGVGRSGAGR
ncbi:hypothetical protein [Crateriforma spongiae]|uniref:hypothetical protein n=1 Tax=Crateriforma spongiae TaxID=2724528 RepID=UPI0039AEF1AD